MVTQGRELGIDKFAVFPMPSNVALNMAAMRDGIIDPQGALDRVPYAFENRRHLAEIYDLFPDAGAFTIPFVFIDPLREPEAQARELRKLREQYTFYGLKTQTTVLQAPIKSLLREGRAFLDLCEEWDLPFLIHSSVLPADIWAQASDILDIAEQFPQVRFCAAHSLRYDREQLDRLATLPNAWFDCSAHRIHCILAQQDSPVVAPAERRFPSDYSRPEQVLSDLAEAYPQKLMWGSDSPYYSYVATISGVTLSLRSTYREEVDCLAALPSHVKHAVCAGNTLDFLKMK
jgi:predicted TIM-barrel fold metal-dependent hydrolase